MPYVGNIPAEQYASFEVQHFTTSATTSYTLTHAVANELDIRLVINNVIQQPGGSYAYTAAGTTLTLSAATAGTDTMYCVYIGKAVQTVTPGAGSVGTTALTDNAVTLAKMASGTDGNIISYDASGNPVAVSTGSSGQVLTSAGAGAAPSFAAASGTTINNNADNRVITGSGTANTLEGEANLTYTGSVLKVNTTDAAAHGNADDLIVGSSSGNHGITIYSQNNSTGNIHFSDGTSGADQYRGQINYDHTANNLQFHTDGSEKVRITSEASAPYVKVGIGETAPLGILHVKSADSGASPSASADELVIENSGQVGLSLLGPDNADAGIYFGNSGDNGDGRVVYNPQNNAMYFWTNGGNKMSIRPSNANSGSLAIGSTSWDTWYHFQMRFNGNAGGGMVLDNSETDTNGTAYIYFKQGNSNIGSINRNGTTSAVSYNTSSDYRLKENVNYTWDATTKLKELKPAKFSWKSDPSNQIVDGFIAHEVSDIVPEATTGTKDETETKEKVVISSDGTITAEYIEEADWIKGKEDNTYENDTTWEATKVVPKYQQIDQAKLVPLLVKTIQELEARITTLENA